MAGSFFYTFSTMHPSLTQLGESPIKMSVSDRVRQELTCWIDTSHLSRPSKFSDLRPLPKLAVLGLAVTAPYYSLHLLIGPPHVVLWHNRKELYDRSQRLGPEQALCRRAFRLHESIVVGNNPLTWLYHTSPVVAAGTLVGSVGVHVFALRPLARRYLASTRPVLAVNLAIAGFCAFQSLYCRMTAISNVSSSDWIRLASGKGKY